MKCGTPIVFVLYFNFFYFFAEDRWSLSVPKEDSGPKSVRGQPKADSFGCPYAEGRWRCPYGVVIWALVACP